MANTLWQEYADQLKAYIINSNPAEIGKQTISSPDRMSIALADREALWSEYNRAQAKADQTESGLKFRPIRMGGK